MSTIKEEFNRAYTIIKKIGKGKLPMSSLYAKKDIGKHAFTVKIELISEGENKWHERYVLACESKLRSLLHTID